MAKLRKLPVLLQALVCLTISTATAVAEDGYEYPTGDPPKPGIIRREDSQACPSCPWNRSELGQYPIPFNVKSQQFEPLQRGAYFDVYCDWITTRYSEVFWTAQPAVPVPADIRAKFQGRAMSLTGFEVDVVSGGETEEDPEWSVPEWQVYNHHYFLTMVGQDAKMIKLGERAQDSLLHDYAPSDSRTRGRHAIEIHPPEWEPRDIAVAPRNSSIIPTAQLLVQGNGGEHRKSWKHLPRGTGQLLLSPQTVHLQPMLINTHFPAQLNQTARQAFHEAILPRTSQSPPGANYSGLLECPCTTRTQKIITGFETRSKGVCGPDATLTTEQECFQAAAQLIGASLSNVTLDSTQFPAGCYLVASKEGTEAFWNSNPDSPGQCGTKEGVPIRSMGSAGVTNGNGRIGVRLELDEASDKATLTLTGPAHAWFAIGWNASVMADQPYTIVVDGPNGTVTERVLGNHEGGSALEPSIQVQSNTVGPPPAPLPVPMNHNGMSRGDSEANSWQSCRDQCQAELQCQAWTYIPARFSTPYNLQQGTCRMRHGDPKTTAAASVEEGFTSNGWVEGMWSGEMPNNNNNEEETQVRNLVLTRPLKGLSPNHYSFDPSTSSIPYIEAVGTSPDFGYHGAKGRGGGTIVMVETGAPICICRGQNQGGSINGIPWADNCEAYPATTIKQDNNPSCSIETYQGGMICCHHGIFLLDADQEVPAPTFKFRMKFRFWYEDPEAVTADSTVGPSVSQLVYPGLDYQNAFFVFRETEIAHGEYDVPRCAKDTPVEECVHTVTGHFQVHESMRKCKGRADVWCAHPAVNGKTYPMSQHIALIHISPHCHGPACISMEMVNADTNETICYTEPHYGTSDQAMDEAGYAAGIPPCLWGSPEEGLPFPPILSLDTNITVIKKVNSTVGHLGVMGHWQMRAIWAADPSENAKGRTDDEEIATR